MALPKSALLLFSCVLLLIGVMSYEVRTLEPCYPDNTIWLGNNDKSALNFSLGNFKFDQQSSDTVFKCSFHIEADRNEKIIAVVQRMNLREIDHNCLDYVEFSDLPKLSLSKLYDRMNNIKRQMCRNLNVSIMSLPNDMVLHAFNKYTLPRNVYITNRNELKVKVVISKTPLKRDETLDFQIIFTAARMGSDCKDNYEFDCGNNTCIWKGFYKDGFVNCPFVRCPDEDGCEGLIIKYSSGSGTTIIICAVVSMLSVLGVFLLCLFICRRCKVLCWAHVTTSARDPGRVHVSSSHPAETVQPSAPPLISLHDKDLPPSYDSLFPARSTLAGVCLVKDDGIERGRRSRIFSSQRLQTVCIEGGTMRYNRGKNNNHTSNSGLNQNADRGEVTPSISRNRGPYRRYLSNQPNSHEQSRGRYFRYHRPKHGLWENHEEMTQCRQKGRRRRNRNRRKNPNQISRIESYNRVRTQTETALTTRSREQVRCRRNSEGSKWYHDLWQACCL